MPKFRVTAVDSNGVSRNYSVEAASEKDAIARVKTNRLFTTNVEVIREHGIKSGALPPARHDPLAAEHDMPLQECGTPAKYVYKMVQIPTTVLSRASSSQSAAAQYLEQGVNTMEEEGWEFYRVDTLGVEVPAGCLAALFGAPAQIVYSYVVTFRRLRD